MLPLTFGRQKCNALKEILHRQTENRLVHMSPCYPRHLILRPLQRYFDYHKSAILVKIPPVNASILEDISDKFENASLIFRREKLGWSLNGTSPR